MFQVGGKGGRHYRTLAEANAAADSIFQRKGVIVSIVEKPEPKSRTHYHIGNGTPGCMFDSVTGPYTNRRDAERAASRESRDHVADYNDPDVDHDHMMTRWVGKDKDGRPALYVCEVKRVPYGNQYYWEIFPCSDPDCMDENNQWTGW